MPTKFLSLIFLFMLFGSTLQGQNDLKSYLNALDSIKDKDQKLNVLDSILKLTRGKEHEIYAKHTEDFVALAKELQEYDRAARAAIRSFYCFNILLNDPDRGLKLVEGMLPYEDKLTTSRLKGGLYLKRADGYANGKNLNEAKDNYDKALERYTEKDSLQIADTYLFRGRSKSYSGDFFGGINDYRKSYDYFESLKDKEYMLNAQQGIITIYSVNGFLDEAKKERDKLFELAKGDKFKNLLLTEHYNQSLDYKKQDRQTERKESLLKAAKFISADTDLYYSAMINGELADFYGEQNNIEESRKYLELVETELKKDRNIDNYIRSAYYTSKANYLKNTGMYSDALDYALKKNKIAQDFNYKEDIMNTQKLLSEIYEEKGDHFNSIKYFKKYNHLKDSLFGVTKANALVYYQTLYETEKKEKEIIEKNGEINLLEEKNDYKKKQLIIGGLGLSAFFGFILLARNRKHLKKSQILQEKYTQDLLVSQEEERKRVSKDLHDSIGQSLLLIKNKIILNKDDGTKDIVDSAIEEVRSISRALHPFQLEELGITKAVENVIRQVDETTDIFVSSEIDTIDALFSQEKEVNIYRIVQESLNNIIKHAEAKAVRVDIIKKNRSVVMTIKDNGVGFDFSERYNDFKSLGLKTLKERTKFLNGIMSVDSEKSKGTTLEFRIPIA